MKRLLTFAMALCMLAGLAGCKQKPVLPTDETNIQTDVSTAATEESTLPAIQVPMTSVYVPILKEEETAEDGTVIYTHEYQNMSLTLQDPDVANKVILDFLNRADSRSQASQNVLASAKKTYEAGKLEIPYYSGIIYEPTRMDQGVLSLFGRYVEYTGRNHGAVTTLSANYDLAHGDVLTLASILKIGADPAMFQQLVLAKLAEKEDTLYPDYEAYVKERFSVDPSQDEAFFFTPTGIDFYFSPYEIAPYSAGTVIVELSYEELVGLVADAFFPAEKNETLASVIMTPFNKTDLTDFNQISEAVIDKDGTMLLAHADDTVQNLRIIIGRTDYDQGHVIFEAQTLSPGDAVMVQATEDQFSGMYILYDNKEGSQELSLAIN